METTEADGELQIITECWIEPQYGTVVNSTPEREHFDGLHFHQLAHAVSYYASLTMHVSVHYIAGIATHKNSLNYFHT